jgi:carotenoid cleavage dioxygenase-like enzyme
MPGKHSKFYIHGYAEDGSSILQEEFTQFGMTIIHDFMITDHYVIIMENPVIPEIPILVKSMFGLDTLMKALKQQERPARLMLFPRKGGPPRIIEMDATYLAFHHGSAREILDDNGEPKVLEFFSCIFDRYVDFGNEFGYQGNNKPYADQFSTEQPPQFLRKVTLDLKTEKCNVEKVTDWAIDFPVIHPDRNGRGSTHIYGSAASPKGTFNPFDTFCRVDLTSGECQTWKSDCGFLGEGYFVPTGETEEAGYILVMAYRTDGTELLILQAEDLSSGPLARVALPEAFPYGFHGYFQPPQV